MAYRVMITGSSGLIGRALCAMLEVTGAAVARLDLRGSGEDHGDIRDLDRLRQGIAGCDGVIHLAAVSRVVWGERDPDLCWSTNVGGTHNVLEAAARAPQRPWVICVSSREVYGHPQRLPAGEDTPLEPINIYGRSKAAVEDLVAAARRDGLRAAVIRLSNVFGATNDHADRVVPAFVRAALQGTELRVDGAEHTFDFTHLDDVVRGILALARLLDDGVPAPLPIQLVTGVPTTLLELAQKTISLSSSRSRIRMAPPRDFDVARFYGLGDRARTILGWAARVTIEEGLARLIAAHRQEIASGDEGRTAP